MSPRAIISSCSLSSHPDLFFLFTHTHTHTHTHLFILPHHPLSLSTHSYFILAQFEPPSPNSLSLPTTTMCLNTSQWNPYTPICLRRSKIRVKRLTKWRSSSSSSEGSEMEIKNLKLYLENRSMIEENAMLRKKALLLHKENQALMLEFKKKFSHQLPIH